MFPNILRTNEWRRKARPPSLKRSLFRSGECILNSGEILQECKYAHLGICILKKMVSRKITEDLQIVSCTICEGRETRIELYPCSSHWFSADRL